MVDFSEHITRVFPVFTAADTFALFDDAAVEGGTRLFFEPTHTLRCFRPEDVSATFDALAAAHAQGLFAVMVADYALGMALEPSLLKPLPTLDTPYTPLFVVHCFARSVLLNTEETEHFFAQQLAALPPQAKVCGIADKHIQLTETAYVEAVSRILRYIEAGDCYQVNFTFSLSFSYFGAPLALYAKLRAAQAVRYGAFVQTTEQCILCHSPELFLERKAGEVLAKPMKGTAPRGASAIEDEQQRQALSVSAKDQAENLMIVDLIRNDLGRLAAPGKVKVSRLFEVEAYATLFQMTSTVTASLPDASIECIFRALFPCGSVTGAPKRRAMQIIAELERTPRGVYTGALGWFAPDGDFLLNVPIRTLVLSREGGVQGIQGVGCMGVGSGIVADSDPAAEYAECLLKTRFLTGLAAEFELIESLLFEAGFPLLEAHLQRLSASARFFGFTCPVEDIRHSLLDYAHSLPTEIPYKVRLLLNKQGKMTLSSSVVEPAPVERIRTVGLSETRVDSQEVFLYHKTTVRQRFETALAKAGTCFDVLFCNERGELTSGARSNVFVQLNGRIYTPPVHCGLLNGVMRQKLLHDSQGAIVERVLYPADLKQAEAIYASNAVRGWMSVEIADDEEQVLI